MAANKAAFYSCKAGKPETVKSHRLRRAALSAAGEMGQIWDSERAIQRQVHMSTNGNWMTVAPDEFLAADLAGTLRKQGLVD